MLWLATVVPADDLRDLPEGVRRLLLGPVDAFEKLEVLLALHARTDASRAAELATATGVAERQVEAATAALEAAGLVERHGGGWRVRGASPDAPAVAELAAAWAASRPAIMKVMTQRALERIRASAARAFADAFRLRRRDDDGGEDA